MHSTNGSGFAERPNAGAQGAALAAPLQRLVGRLIEASFMLRLVREGLARGRAGDRSGIDCKQPPLSGDASKHMRTTVVEVDSRSGHKILDGG